MRVSQHARSVSLPVATRRRLAIAGVSAGVGLAGAFAISAIGGEDDGAGSRAARGAAATVPLRFDDPTVIKGARGGAFNDPPVIKGARGAALDGASP
jgi:hypothetical protein